MHGLFGHSEASSDVLPRPSLLAGNGYLFPLQLLGEVSEAGNCTKSRADVIHPPNHSLKVVDNVHGSQHMLTARGRQHMLTE